MVLPGSCAPGVSEPPLPAFPQAPPFSLSSCQCRLQRRGVPAGGTASEGCQAGALFSPTPALPSAWLWVPACFPAPRPWPLTAAPSPSSASSLAEWQETLSYGRTGVKRDTQRALSMLILWHVKESPPNASVKVKRPHGELGGLVCSQLCSFLALSPWARGLTSLVPLVPLM